MKLFRTMLLIATAIFAAGCASNTQQPQQPNQTVTAVNNNDIAVGKGDADPDGMQSQLEKGNL